MKDRGAKKEGENQTLNVMEMKYVYIKYAAVRQSTSVCKLTLTRKVFKAKNHR